MVILWVIHPLSDCSCRFLWHTKINTRFYDQNWGTEAVRETDEVLFSVTRLWLHFNEDKNNIMSESYGNRRAVERFSDSLKLWAHISVLQAGPLFDVGNRKNTSKLLQAET